MTTYAAVNHQEKFINALIEKIELAVKNGDKMPWVKPWKTSPQDCYSFNMTTGSFYNGLNAIMLPPGGYITYNQAKANNLRIKLDCIKNYEVGFFYTFVATKETKHLPEAQQEKFPIFKTFQVYHFDCLDESSQLKAKEKFKSLSAEGLKEELDKNKPLHDVDTLLKKYIETLAGGFKNNNRAAYYNPVLDMINVPKIENFNSSVDYYSTLLHELVHSTGRMSIMSTIAN